MPQRASLLAPGSWLRCALGTRSKTQSNRFKAVPVVWPCCPAHRNGRLGYMPTPRRTVYMHDDWVRHRSSDRFVRNMLTIGSSGINQALSKEMR